jgi:uncharacterized protein (TIRG00374 family)
MGAKKGFIVTVAKIATAGAIILFIVTRKIDWAELLTNLRGISKTSLAVYWGLFLAGMFISSRRWQTLVRVHIGGVRYGEIVRFYFIGHFFNNIMLGSMGGDIVKAYLLAKRASTQKEEAVITVIADRLVGFSSIFGIGLVGLCINSRDETLRPVIMLFLAFFFAVFLGMIAIFQKNMLRKIPLFHRLLHKLPFEATVRRLYEAFYAYRFNKGAVARAFLLSCGMQMLNIYIIFGIAHLLGIDELAFTRLFLFVPLIGVIMSVPITPAGWGTGELAYCELFGTVGVGWGEALALGLMVRAVVISWSLVGGILYAFPGRRIAPAAFSQKES